MNRKVESAGRDSSVDIMRAMAMLLVLFGHGLQMFFENRADNDVNTMAFQIWKAIYSFHMPAFFFVSGLVSDKMLAQSCRQVLARSLSLIFFVDILQLIFAGSVVRHADSPARLFYQAIYPLLAGQNHVLTVTWFLISLAVVTALASLHECSPWPVRLLIWLVALVAMQLNAVHGWAIYQSQTWAVGLAFYLFGNRWSQLQPHALWLHKKSALLIGAVLAMVCLWFSYPLNDGPVAIVANPGGRSMFGVLMVNGIYGNWFLFAVSAVSGTMFLFFCASLLGHVGYLRQAFGWLGRRTLALLVINGIILRFANHKCSSYLPANGPKAHPILGCLIYVLVQVAMAGLLGGALMRLYECCKKGAQRSIAWT